MIQVINRAIDILEYLAQEPDRPKPLSEIAEHFNLNAGTCANIIKTLVNRKFIDKLEKKQGYCLGAKAYALTGNEGYKKELIAVAKEEMEKLTAKLDENSLLAVLHNDIRLVVASVISSHPVQAITSTEKKAYDSSTGRLLVSMLSATELASFLDKFGIPKPGEWDDVNDEESFMRQVKKVRQQGYAVQITANKIVGLAVPVYKATKVIASLSIYLPDYRYSKSDKKELISLLNTSAKRISDALI